MKYLEYPVLENLNQAFACLDAGDFRVFGRIEAYSCKDAGQDRKLRHYIDAKYQSEDFSASMGRSPLGKSLESLSPRSPSEYLSVSFSRQSTSPFGPLTQTTSRRTYFYLLATLNCAFPDYDFSDINPEAFVKITSLATVVNAINTMLFNIGNEKFSQVAGSTIWDSITEVLEGEDFEIYRFEPDENSEPSKDGALWSFYYFFFSRKLKRVVFFTLRAVSFIAPLQAEENMEYIEDFDMELSDTSSDRVDVSYEQYTMFEQEV